ncbi:OLC1v1022721C1 [Oldenlandia corymbosa var. corymbosa]|uniref:OLC1v1022721C1 n=1 Tax=Oldenlandia corymbosa var. corymbosa TaxID=529605 RepID=A0AAV1C0W1_OLDCO|nr:OLC1v1022721C1 [Oldenlandia corymbosa var. corymbosa]
MADEFRFDRAENLWQQASRPRTGALNVNAANQAAVVQPEPENQHAGAVLGNFPPPPPGPAPPAPLLNSIQQMDAAMGVQRRRRSVAVEAGDFPRSSGEVWNPGDDDLQVPSLVS